MKYKVLCVTETLGLGGGAERLLVSLIPELSKAGIDVDILSLFCSREDLGLELENQGHTVHRLNMSHRWAIYEAIYGLVKLLNQCHYDILWGHLYFGNFYSQLAKFMIPRLKAIVTFHSPGYAQSPPVGFWENTRVIIEKIIVGRESVTKVAVSQAVANDYANFFGWNNIEVIYNGIPTMGMPNPITGDEVTQLRLKHGFALDDFILIVPARFVREKGHVFLLEAARLFKYKRGWCPTIIACGRGPLLDELINIAKDLGIDKSVHFIDTIPQKMLFELMLAADAVVMPSIREPFGIVAAEAMALGKPVVLTYVDGFKELVGNSECALLIPPGDSVALLNSIERIYDDEILRQTIGELGRTHVRKNFDIAVCASQWANMLNRVGMSK